MEIKNQRLFITGGGGYLGQKLVEKYYGDNEITIYSRDESKHYFLKKKYPKIRCVIGDIRNYDLMKRASVNHDIGIFAASLKQIEAIDQNVEEAIKVIINGAINSRRIAEENNFKAASFISSDKSRSATTLYGSMKFIAGESFIVDSENSNTKLSSVIYGNVMNSTGSVIPLIWDSIRKNYTLTLYSDKMTRFMITYDEAIELIEKSLDVTGFNVIPDLKSFKISDLFEIYAELFGLKYVVGEPRISEKIHEIMISREEISRVFKKNDVYYMHYKNIYDEKFDWDEYSSANVLISKEELLEYLKKYDFYK